jgi:hypothetical protein
VLILNAFSWQLSTSLCEDFYRSSAKQKNADVCPNYNNTREAKQRSFPTKESFTVTDTPAAVKLHGPFDHTILRIVQEHEIVLFSVAGKMLRQLSWFLNGGGGFDGSTGHSEYKQSFSGEWSDSDLFLTTPVPIQLFNSSSTNRQQRCGRIPAHRLLGTADPHDFSLEKR